MKTVFATLPLGTETKVGSSNPGWRDKIAAKLDASTYYKRTGYITASPAVVRFKSRSNHLRVTGDGNWWLFGSMNPLHVTDTGLYNRALQKAKRQLSKQYGNARLAAPAAELKEMKGLIRQLTFISIDFVQAAIRIKRTRGASARKFLADAWLGYNFGLRPVLSDISDTANALATWTTRQDLTARFRASATDTGAYTYQPTTTAVGTLPFGMSTMRTSGAGNWTLRYQFTGAIDLALRSDDNYSLFDHLGLQFSQIPSVAWELTYCSWVVDYFTNVGQVLDDVFAAPSGATIFTVVSRLYNLDASNSFLPIALPPPNSFAIRELVGGTSRLKYYEYEREPLAALPHATLYFKSFDSVAANAIPKLLNLASVLSGLSKK